MYDQWNNVQRPLIFHGPMLSYPRYSADTLGDREKSTWTINKYLHVSVFLGISDSNSDTNLQLLRIGNSWSFFELRSVRLEFRVRILTRNQTLLMKRIETPVRWSIDENTREEGEFIQERCSFHSVRRFTLNT